MYVCMYHVICMYVCRSMLVKSVKSDLIRRRTRSAGASGGDGDVQYAHGQAEVVRVRDSTLAVAVGRRIVFESRRNR